MPSPWERRSWKNTAGSGRTRGKQTGPPELPRIDTRSARSSRDESPFSGERKLSWEHIGCTIELPRDVDSTQGFELRVTPEEEMAGELWHAVWSYTSQPVDVGDSRCPYGLARACPRAVAGTAIRLDALPTALGNWCAKAVEPRSEPRGCLPVECSAPARAGGICCDNSMPGHLF